MVLKRCFYKLNDYPYYHFSAHVYVPEVNAPQLQANHTYLKFVLDDVWCQKNLTEWDCLLPDWSKKTKLLCNDTCIEHCSLVLEADLVHYLIYAGILVCCANIVVYLSEKYILKVILKNK